MERISEIRMSFTKLLLHSLYHRRSHILCCIVTTSTYSNYLSVFTFTHLNTHMHAPQQYKHSYTAFAQKGKNVILK